MGQALLEEAPMLFVNAKLIDGNGGEPVEDAAVRVEGNRIAEVGRTADFGKSPNGSNRVIDLQGKALMPGLTEGHFHVSFWGVRELPDLDLKLPAELSTIYAVKNAELALRCGYTSVASAGALHRVDVTLRDAIDQGVVPGPRMAASGRDICATSGMLDWNPSFWKLGMDGLSIFADGVEEVRKAVRMNIREGCDVIKLYVTGEGLLRGKPGIPPEETMYSLEEIQAAVREAHTRNRQVAAHVRGDDGVKLCVEAGIDVIEHATYADDEAIEMMAARRGDLFVVPGLGYHWGILTKGLACGISQEMIDASGYQDEWERGCVAMDKLRRAGVRVVPGGDYGFIWCPHGEYAKDIELFVTDMGFSEMEAIVAATKHGSELMRTPDETGTVEVGKLADLLIVDGDPLENIAVLQDRSRLAMVMKDGNVMVNTLGLPQELQPLPDFTMEIERIQQAKALTDPMPSAAEVQH
jgi:imidazolonepropionase-like amidohydrolase